MLKLKLQYFGPLMWKTDSLEKTLMLEKTEGRRRGWQRMRWLMVSPTQWTWVWASSGSWWWTGKPGVLQSMGSQGDMKTEWLNWTNLQPIHNVVIVSGEQWRTQPSLYMHQFSFKLLSPPHFPLTLSRVPCVIQEVLVGSVQIRCSVVSDSETPWISACQASLSITNLRSLLKPLSVKSVGDVIQPSHPLSSPSPPAPNPSQHQDLFQWVSTLHQVAKVLEFRLQHQSFQWTPRTDLLQDGLVGSPCSPRDSQETSPTPQFKSINSSALSFLYSPTLTSIHDHWKNHSLDQTDLCWTFVCFLICYLGWS